MSQADCCARLGRALAPGQEKPAPGAPRSFPEPLRETSTADEFLEQCLHGDTLSKAMRAVQVGQYRLRHRQGGQRSSPGRAAGRHPTLQSPFFIETPGASCTSETQRK